MAPRVLEAAAHQQQATVTQREVQAFPRLNMTELEDPLSPQAQGDDKGVSAELLFFVGVPPHRVVATTVQIGEHAIEAVVGQDLDALSQMFYRRYLGQGSMGSSRVGIVGTRIPIPTDEPWHRDPAAGD